MVVMEARDYTRTYEFSEYAWAFQGLLDINLGQMDWACRVVIPAASLSDIKFHRPNVIDRSRLRCWRGLIRKGTSPMISATIINSNVNGTMHGAIGNNTRSSHNYINVLFLTSNFTTDHQ